MPLCRCAETTKKCQTKKELTRQSRRISHSSPQHQSPPLLQCKLATLSMRRTKRAKHQDHIVSHSPTTTTFLRPTHIQVTRLCLILQAVDDNTIHPTNDNCTHPIAKHLVRHTELEYRRLVIHSHTTHRTLKPKQRDTKLHCNNHHQSRLLNNSPSLPTTTINQLSQSP